MMDTVGRQGGAADIAMSKAAPNMVCQVVHRAIQAFGGTALLTIFGPPGRFCDCPLLRIVGGPGEVHRNQVGRLT